jgi:UDP-N-acetylglucosamine--N-acetylmuramyl-(pentapeptide) pyrophosphoryl-undecaprenol N-acetylglucosamine transferase
MKMGKSTTKILIVGGGTGGHVFPGIAVAQNIQNDSSVEILFIGGTQRMEREWVENYGFHFAEIAAVPFPRRKIIKWISFPIYFLMSIQRAWKIFKKFNPDAVFSTGGYVSAPAALVAVLKRIPLAIFEPNVVPGLTTRFFQFFSRKIFVGFEETMKWFSKKKTSWNGIPIRQEILNFSKAKAIKTFNLQPNVPVLLVLGGSQGARNLNHAAVQAIQFMDQGDHALQVIFMTGRSEFQMRMDQLEKCSIKVMARMFIQNIQDAYAVADLVISRAGALTCGEILVSQVPSILIPYPYASNHQEKNARALEKMGASVVILEKNLNGEELAKNILGILSNSDCQNKMKQAARLGAKRDAGMRIAESILQLTKNKRKIA